MNQQWEKEINEVLSRKGIISTQEIALVVLYHFEDQDIYRRLNLFCELFERQFSWAHPSVRINRQEACLPYVDTVDILPHLRNPHILLLLVSVEFMLELHQTSLYEALTSSPQEAAHRIGVIARSAPLDDDQLRFAAKFPTDIASLVLCQEDDSVFTEIIQKVWEMARGIIEL